MKETRYKIMFKLIKIIFIGLLTDIVSAYNHTKHASLSNQKCMIQPILINLHFLIKSKSHYYSFAVKVEECVGSCNTLNDLYNKICLSKKQKI